MSQRENQLRNAFSGPGQVKGSGAAGDVSGNARKRSNMNKQDTLFFDKHWIDWVSRNPPPKDWRFTMKQWAELEMPCRGLSGRLLFLLGHYIGRHRDNVLESMW